MEEEKKKKATMAVMSGDMDKLMGAFIIATSAAASNMDVTMFFTFWGLRAVKKNVNTGINFMGKMIGFMERGDISKASPSKYNFWGMGRWMFNKMMKVNKVATLPELRQMAIDFGVKLYGCSMSMGVMEIAREDLIDEVVDVVGGAFFVEQAANSDFTLFI
ncbi:MAG: DsrE/DsrF/DrsH-like family protein [Actinobacteria bacterium]|nr:DsrE/DsrF/DrsH-like family protein [Actinomycetota bacterium]